MERAVGGAQQDSERYPGASQPFRERIHDPFLARLAERDDALAVDDDLFGRAHAARGQSYESHHAFAKAVGHSRVVSQYRYPTGSGEGAMRRAQQDSMTIQELNELIERAVAQPGVHERKETKLLGWMLDQQECQPAGAQQDDMTIQELNELIERAVAQPGVREREDSKFLDWVLEYQAA